jgi:TolB-like protein/Tfp pilus assembly protein PilF
MTGQFSFLAELKRRNVIRMAGLYLVGAWLVVQVAGTLLPVFEAPTWVMKTLVGLLALGFVPALIFAWVFELTPQGIKRDAEVKPEESIAPQTARRMDRTIIAVLAIALVYFGFDKFVLAPRREAAAVASATQAKVAKTEPAAPVAADISPKSVAVLPFVNMSGDPKNEFFGDGITEEILNALAQIADLKVAARTSAFAFKGKDPDLRKVGEVLGVATVLEGSVQRSGDDVRITAQLIDARSGFHLWSERYDRKMTNLFAVEDEISKAIADKLQLQLAGVRPGKGGGTGVPQAHELYLRGLSLLAARGTGLRDAVDAFGNAVELDPKYAQAWGALAETEQLLPAYTGGDVGAGMARAETAAQRALGIDPDTASALVAMANVHAYRLEWAQAETALRRALVLAPGDAEAADQYAQFLNSTGQQEAALLQIDRARQLDPLSTIIGVVRTTILMALHRDAEAAAQIEATLPGNPEFYPACMVAVFLYIGLERHADAEAQLRAVARHLGVDPEAKVLLARGIVDPASRTAALDSLDRAPANADIRGDQLVYSAFLALLGEHKRAIDELEGYSARRSAAAGGMLWTRPFDPLRNDPRFKAVLKKMDLPFVSHADAAP